MAPISTRDLSGLPNVPELMRFFQSMAMLDAILSPEWEYRYHSFNAHWDRDEKMASIRDGQGDELFALFNAQGAFLKGFVHDSPAAAARIASERFYRDLPGAFAAYRREPAFSPDDVTFCLWRLLGQAAWSCAKVELPAADDADGSALLLARLNGSPETYREWADEYYERALPLAPVAAIYEHRALTEKIIRSLNPDARREALHQDLLEIGYPA